MINHSSKGIKMKEKSQNKFVISFRVSNDEREALYDQAKRSGLSISELMRLKLELPNPRIVRHEPHLNQVRSLAAVGGREAERFQRR